MDKKLNDIKKFNEAVSRAIRKVASKRKPNFPRNTSKEEEVEAKACVDCGLKKECKIDTQYRNNCLYRRFSKSAPAKSCDTCQFKFLDGVRCVIDPVKCGSYKPKSPDKVHNTVTYLPSQFNPVPDKFIKELEGK